MRNTWIIFASIALFYSVSGEVLTNTVSRIPEEIKSYIDAKMDQIRGEIMSDMSCEHKRCVTVDTESNILQNMENIIFYIRMLQTDIKQLHYGKRVLKSNMRHFINKQVKTVKSFLNKLSADLFNLTSKVDTLERIAVSTESPTTEPPTTERPTTTSRPTTTTVKPTTTPKPTTTTTTTAATTTTPVPVKGM